MPLRLSINGEQVGTIVGIDGVCYVVVNWLVGTESEDTFIAATHDSKFQGVRPGDCVIVTVNKERNASLPRFDGLLGSAKRRASSEFGYDIAVNGERISTIRVPRTTDVTSALVFIHEEDRGGRLSVLADRNERLSLTLSFGDEVCVTLVPR